MTAPEASVLQYGALGLLAIVLVAAIAFLRENARQDADRRRQEAERQAARDTFFEQLFSRVTERLDAVTEAQRQIVSTLGELCKALNGHAERTAAEHEKILDCARQRASRAKAG